MSWTAVRVLIGVLLAVGVGVEAGWVTAVFLLLVWLRLETVTLGVNGLVERLGGVASESLPMMEVNDV